MKVKGWSAGLLLSFLCFSSLLFAERVEVREGTPVRVRLKADMLSTQVHEGNPVYFEVVRPVIIRGMVAIPAGAQVWGAIQSVKEDKVIKFDIQALRLPDLTIINLRTTREKSKKASKDQLKVESDFRDTVGAPKGSEYTAFVDDDVSVEAAAASPAPAARPSAPAPAPVELAPPAPAPTTPAPAPAAAAEPVTLECFSDPTGADIVIDGDFRGTTPSILKIPPGKHHLEYQLSGYNLYSRDLDLKSEMGRQTIQIPLQKKE